jgi:hypothetical protein
MQPKKRRTRERHGLSYSPTYRSWTAMKQRCEDPKYTAYDRYGGRGIYVCARWSKSFLSFLEDMGERPDGTSLDRIDNDGPYEPGNCRWATHMEQQRNRRNNRVVMLDGQRTFAAQVAKDNGIESGKFRGRLHAGWTVEESVGMKKHPSGRNVTVHGETMNLSQWADKTGISRQAIDLRIRGGWPIEDAVSLPKGAKRPA